MLAVRIPTGIIEYTANVTAQRPIIYRCCRCGREQVHLTEIKASASGVYHALSSATKKSATQEQARAGASTALDAVDEKTAYKINAEHEYGYVSSVATCGACGAVQPWSTVPRPWLIAEHDVWLVCTVLFALMAPFFPTMIAELALGERSLRDSGDLIMFVMALTFFVAFVALLAYWIVYVARRRSARKKMLATPFEPPTYVSKAKHEQWERERTASANVRRMTEGPTQRRARFCPNCGTKLSVGGYFCPNCGAPIHS